MPNLTTIAKWAETLGISRQQGYAAVERCDIPVKDGKVDQDYATHLYNTGTRKRANHQRPAAPAGSALPSGGAGEGGAASSAKVPGYESSRARREAAEAQLAEIKLGEMGGKFLLKQDVENQAFGIARALRDGLMNCARRIAADVAGLSTAEECEEVIERELSSLLGNLAHSLKADLGVDVAEAVQ